MRLKGFEVKQARHLGFRDSDPKRDFHSDGTPYLAHHVAFVSLKDCPTYFKDGRKYYDPSNAPSLPGLDHGGSFYAYGKWRKSRKDAGPRWINKEIHYSYWTAPVYFAWNGRVYRGTCHRATDPNVPRVPVVKQEENANV